MIINSATATFTRPVNTTEYAVGDLVANSTDAGEVLPLEFNDLLFQNYGEGYIVKAKLSTSQTTFNGILRLHLFKVAPAVVADNAAYPLLSAEQVNYIGNIDFISFFTGGSGSEAAVSVIKDERLALKLASDTGASALYGLLETRAVFTPASGQTFTVEITTDGYEY